MAIRVGPSGGGRELIGLSYMAGVGKAEQRREELAQRERADLRRLQYGAQQAGYDRLARERQLMFQAGVQGERDEAARLERGQADELRREQDLADVGMRNEEFDRREVQEFGLEMRGEQLAVAMEENWTEQQKAQILGKVQAWGNMGDDFNDEQKRLAWESIWQDVDRMTPAGEPPVSPISDEELAMKFPNVKRNPQTGEFSIMLGGEEYPALLEYGAHGPNFKVYEPKEPPQLDQFGDDRFEQAARQRDIETKYEDATRKWESDVEADVWRIAEVMATEHHTEAMADYKAKNVNVQNPSAPPRKPTPGHFEGKARIEAERRAEVSRPRPPRLPDSMLPGLQPGEGGVLPGEPTPAELAEGRLPIIPAAEAADLPRVNDPAEVANLPPGSQFIDPSGTIRRVPEREPAGQAPLDTSALPFEIRDAIEANGGRISRSDYMKLEENVLPYRKAASIWAAENNPLNEKSYRELADDLEELLKDYKHTIPAE